MIEYEFTIPEDSSSKENYIKLLCKYYPNVKCKIITEDNEIIAVRMNNDLLLRNDISRVNLITEAITDNYACIRVLPEKDPIFFVHATGGEATKIRVSKGVKKLRDFLDKLLEDISKVKLPISYITFETTTYLFGDVLNALRYVHSVDSITRCYINYQEEKVILVIKEEFVLGITRTKITWANLPIFDVEEGFTNTIISDPWFSVEWHSQFNWWHDKLVESNYTHWNEPIFPKDYSWTLLVKQK